MLSKSSGLSGRLALLKRTSSEEQKQRQTIDRQREALRDLLVRYPDCEVTGDYEDEGVSGTIPLEERPAGKRLLADAKAKRFDTVVVLSLDRFGRSLQTIVNGYQLLQQQNIDLYVADSPLGVIDTTNPLGKFSFQLLALIAELERDMIVDRTQSVKKIRMGEGKWVTSRIPYGYDVGLDGKLVENPDEAAVVREIFRRYGAGETAQEICDDLNRRGVPTKQKFHSGKALEFPWEVSKLSKWWRKSLYTGTITYKGGAFDGVAASVPRLIDAATWQRVQQVRQERHNTGWEKRSLLLSSLFRCSLCGGNFVKHKVNANSKWRQGDYTYYACTNARGDNWKDAGLPHRCHSKMIREEELDQLVLSQLKPLIDNPVEFIKRLTNADALRGVEEKDLVLREQTLLKTVREREQELDRLLDLYTSNRISYEQFDRREPAKRAELQEAERTLRQVQMQRLSLHERSVDESSLVQEVIAVRQQWDTLAQRDRRRFLTRVLRGGEVVTHFGATSRQKWAEVKLYWRIDEQYLTGTVPGAALVLSGPECSLTPPKAINIQWDNVVLIHPPGTFRSGTHTPIDYSYPQGSARHKRGFEMTAPVLGRVLATCLLRQARGEEMFDLRRMTLAYLTCIRETQDDALRRHYEELKDPGVEQLSLSR